MAEQNINPRETGDWSVETLFAHLTAVVGEVDRRYEQRFDASEKAIMEVDRRYEQRFVAQERATAIALAANEKRLDGMNEFRLTLSDQARQFLPRIEGEQRIDQAVSRVERLEKQVSEYIAGATGRSGGLSDYVGWLFGAAGFVAAIAAIVTH